MEEIYQALSLDRLPECISAGDVSSRYDVGNLATHTLGAVAVANGLVDGSTWRCACK